VLVVGHEGDLASPTIDLLPVPNRRPEDRPQETGALCVRVVPPADFRTNGLKWRSHLIRRMIVRLRAMQTRQRFWLERAGGDRDLADRLRSEFYSELGKRSGSRRRAKAAKRRAEELRELRAQGVEVMSADEVLGAAVRQVKR
jgi:hypothetical protein